MQFRDSHLRQDQMWSAWEDWDRRDRPRPPALLRLLIPVIVSLIVQVPWPLFRIATAAEPSVFAWISLALAVAAALALLWTKRFPGPVVVVVTVLACADLLLSGSMQGAPYVALAFAIVSALVRNARVWAWSAVGAGWATTVGVGLITGLDWHPGRVAITTLGILIVFGIGESMRTRREHLAEFRRRVAERKQTEVQAERVRIARELHDVLAHSLSQINVQASVGLHLAGKQPEKAVEALANIKETSKTALDEVRSVLGVLRAEGGQDPSAPLVPEPDLSRLAGLAASVTAQGVDVGLTVEADGAPQSVQLAVYRIVQESLTNVIRHAAATQATVDVRATDGTVVVRVDDNGRGMAETDPAEGGRGLLGMRERAELLGGSLETAPSALGGLSVIARMPIKEANT